MREDLILYNNENDYKTNIIRSSDRRDINTSDLNSVILTNLLLNLQQQQMQQQQLLTTQNDYEINEESLLEKIIKLILIALFIMWLCAGLFLGKGWNPFVTIPDVVNTIKIKVVNSESTVGETKSTIKVCVGDNPCVTDENTKK